MYYPLGNLVPSREWLHNSSQLHQAPDQTGRDKRARGKSGLAVLNIRAICECAICLIAEPLPDIHHLICSASLRNSHHHKDNPKN